MSIVFFITFLIWLITAVHSIIIKKRVIGLNLFVFTGIYVPMGMYFLGWSLYVDLDISEKFYYIFICLNIALIIYNLLVEDKCTFNTSLLPQRVTKSFILIVDFGYIALFLIESYMGSGSFAPALNGIDIHTYSAPIIAFVTRSLYAFVILNVLAFIATKEKKYLFFVLILITLPAVTRNMRITSMTTLVQVGSFVAVYLAASWRTIGKKTLVAEFKSRIAKQKIAAVVAIIAAVAFVGVAVMMTNDRMNHYGRYDLSYSNEIAYIGPEFMSDAVSVYYGYFPLSFNNLNLSLKYGEANHNYIGLYSYQSLYFGICQFDNIFGLDSAEPSLPNHRVTSSSAATVATAFWDYWFDYGYLCFIPILLMVAICGWITKRLKAKPTLLLLTQYHYFIPLVFFESFQNLFFGAETLIQVMMMAVLIKCAFKSQGRSASISFVSYKRGQLHA